MGQQDQSVDGVAIADLRRLIQACSDALERLDEADTEQESFEANSALLKRVEELRTAALKSRDQAIANIWRAEEMALAKLASRVGLSKARADQILREQTGRDVYPSIESRNARRKGDPQ